MIYKNILEMIGGTRLLEISRHTNTTIAAKLEGDNIGGSVKDRPVKSMLLAALKSGELTKDKTILEATSGNTGIAFAMLGAALGYQVTLVMSEAVSTERRKLMKAYGAEIVLTPGDQGTDGAIRRAKELGNQNPGKYFYADQHGNKNNPRAHKTTANEIWKQTKGRVTHFVATVGTGGTIMGVGKRLRELNPNIKIIEVQAVVGHKIQGLRNMQESASPSIYSAAHADFRIMVTDEQAFETARQLARKGLLVGMSSGAALFAANQIVKDPNIVNPNQENLIIVIFPDGGMKYLSTPLFGVHDDNYVQAPNLYNKYEMKEFSKEYLCRRKNETC